jgi:hypothetical protein
VAEEVDAVIVAPACACESEVEACQGGLYEVFIVSTDVDCGAWGKVGLFGIGDEGGEGVVVV